MSSQAAMEEGGAFIMTADVTIYLVPPNSAMEPGPEQGSIVTRKRSRQSVEPSPLPLGTIHAVSSRLRECSRYFETCMSGRWTTPTQREFHLEAHTEVQFYQECFARMYWPVCKPIESVGNCIELLKVASQIQYDHVVDVGVRYLASVPWSEEEEKQIRSFYTSGQLSSSCASDLCTRLQMPSSGEERQQKLLDILERVLSRSLQTSYSYAPKSRRESQKVFKETFKAIVTGSGPRKCWKFLPIALNLVMEELAKLLSSVKKGCQEGQYQERMSILLQQIGRVCNLFWLLRWARSAQTLVEFLLKDGDIAPLLQAKFQSISLVTSRTSREEKKWAKMIGTIFQDVLDGHMFLKTSERLALFQRWNWLLKADSFEPDAPLNPTLVSRFIMGLPYAEQEEMFRCWLSCLDDPGHQEDYDLSEAHSLWVKHLVSQAERLADAPECSGTG